MIIKSTNDDEIYLSDEDALAGYKDKNGKLIVPANTYDTIQVRKHCIIVTKGKHMDELYGLLDPEGNEILPCMSECNYYLCERETTCILMQHGQVGVINLAGEIIVPLMYDFIHWREGDFAEVEKDGFRGLMTKTGEIRIPIIFDNVNWDEGEYVSVEMDGRCGMMNTKGDVIIPLVYEEIFHFGEGWGRPIPHDHALAKRNGKWGEINLKNEVIVPFEHDDWHWD